MRSSKGPCPEHRTERSSAESSYARRLLRIRCSALVRDEARRIQERNDEFWYFGEEIGTYRELLQHDPDPDHQAAVDDAVRRVAGKHDFAAVAELSKRFAELAR